MGNPKIYIYTVPSHFALGKSTTHTCHDCNENVLFCHRKGNILSRTSSYSGFTLMNYSNHIVLHEKNARHNVVLYKEHKRIVT